MHKSVERLSQGDKALACTLQAEAGTRAVAPVQGRRVMSASETPSTYSFVVDGSVWGWG